MDILRRWALEYRVDGFRFDLAAILTRAAGTLEAASAFGDDASAGGVLRGTPLSHPPLVAAICEDGVLRGVKLIAEPWDAGGLNQVGAFPTAGGVWAEWNGLFRDDVRRFIKGACIHKDLRMIPLLSFTSHAQSMSPSRQAHRGRWAASRSGCAARPSCLAPAGRARV